MNTRVVLSSLVLVAFVHGQSQYRVHHHVGSNAADPDGLGDYINGGGSVSIIGFKKQKQAMINQLAGMQKELASTSNDPNTVWTIEQQAAKAENQLQEMYQQDLAAKDAQVFDKPPPNAYPHKKIATPSGGVMASHYVDPKM